VAGSIASRAAGLLKRPAGGAGVNRFGTGAGAGAPGAPLASGFKALQPWRRLVDFCAGDGVTLGLSPKGEVLQWSADEAARAAPTVLRDEEMLQHVAQSIHAGAGQITVLMTLTGASEQLLMQQQHRQLSPSMGPRR
jgi:hypothetical protein